MCSNYFQNSTFHKPKFLTELIYYALVYPYLAYGNLIWGNTYKSRIKKLVNTSGVLAGGAGGPRPPQLAILGGRKNEKEAPIPRRILKVGGKNAFEKT